MVTNITFSPQVFLPPATSVNLCSNTLLSLSLSALLIEHHFVILLSCCRASDLSEGDNRCECCSDCVLRLVHFICVALVVGPLTPCAHLV
jgi:hypothetical protein